MANWELCRIELRSDYKESTSRGLFESKKTTSATFYLEAIADTPKGKRVIAKSATWQYTRVVGLTNRDAFDRTDQKTQSENSQASFRANEEYSKIVSKLLADSWEPIGMGRLQAPLAFFIVEGPTTFKRQT